MSNIFLVGPMGSGKSTIGRQLAKKLGKKFFDSDKEIETRTGVSISWIFEMEGEAGFRERESKVIDELTSQEGIVLATGGGAILSEINRRYLHERGMVVYLSATAEQLYKRTAKDKKRPLLQTGDRRQKIDALLKERDPLYQQVAHIILRTSNKSIQHTVNELNKRIKQKTTQT